MGGSNRCTATPSRIDDSSRFAVLQVASSELMSPPSNTTSPFNSSQASRRMEPDPHKGSSKTSPACGCR